MSNWSSKILRSIIVLFLLLNNPVESRTGSSSSSASRLRNANSRGTSSSRYGVSSSSGSSSISKNRGSSSSSSSSSKQISSSASGSSSAKGLGTGSSRINAASSVMNTGGSSYASANNNPSGIASYTTGRGAGSFIGSNNFKSAIVGAAAGYVTYKGGKAIIKSVSSPVAWRGRNYYWSSNDYKKETDHEMCSVSIEDDAYFGNFAFDDGSRPKQVVWSCRSNSESCCGYECCSNITGTGISTVDGSTNSTQNTSQAPLSNLSSSPTEANEIAITDCYDIKRQNPVAADGVYAVQPNNTSLPFEVYCDMNTDNGGWTVFQRRIDGLQDFASQNWIDYEDGFGDVQYDHWLGLEKLYWLMEKDAGLPVQMRVDMTDCTGHTLFETYESFLIGDASTKYALLNASGVNGTAGDAFSALPTQIGSKFSTEDDENSNASDTCATALKGGWWYSSCESAHLNSVYYPQCNNSSLNKDGITWSTASKQDGSSYSPTMTKMMIRKSRFPSF